MDTSEKYILMCEKAHEIQKEVKVELQDGDFYVMEGRLKIRIFSEELWQLGYPREVFEGEKPIWLPREDQLQEMIEGTLNEKISKFNKFITLPSEIINHEGEWMIRIGWETLQPLNYTFEILWLMVVMKEKYNKIWNEDHQDWRVK